MLNFKEYIKKFVLTVVLIFFLLPLTARVLGQTSFGGPFKPDSQTVLLMHFDGNLDDASSTRKAKTSGKISFIENSQIPGEMGQQLRIDNRDDRMDSYLQFADSSLYDLQGTWTMQLWFNIFTSGSDKRQDPRLIIKPGNPHYHSNYFVYLRTSNRRFITGHFENTGNNSWIQIASSEKTIDYGRWHYLTYMRDTSRNMLVQIIHQLDEEGVPKLVNFQTLSFDPATQSPPLTNDNPLYIGRGGATTGQRFDGFMDELRISNVVRKSTIPGLLQRVEPQNNQSPGLPIDFRTEIALPRNIRLDSVRLYYKVDDQPFKSVRMKHESGDTYTSSIAPQNDGSTITYYMRAWTDYGMDSRAPFSRPGKENYYDFQIGYVTAKKTGVNALPQSIKLNKNYPNPFNPSTTISYELPKQMKVNLSVYTVNGRKVSTLVDQHQSPGKYEITYNPESLSSGLYLYILEAGREKRIGKMIVLK